MDKYKKLKRKRIQTRIRIAFNMLVFMFAILTTAVCIAGIKVSDYFEEKTGKTIEECYNEGLDAVAGSKPSDFRSDKATNIYMSDGTKMATVYKNKENSYLDYSEIPQNAVNAFVAIEDRSFWENSGIDYKGIARVFYRYVKTGGDEMHGASTITQQLARQKYLTLDRTFSRKVSELAVAQELAEMYSKQDIMEFYVNMCCYANGIYGLQDASMFYFGKDAKDLSLSQTAYLCAIPNWPEHYNPLKDETAPITRRNKILSDMKELGFINNSEYNQATSEKISVIKPDKNADKEDNYGYETTYAIHCATKYLMQKDGFEFRYTYKDDTDYRTYSSEYRSAYDDAKEKLFSGGYDIYTTIDGEMQKTAQAAVDNGLSPFEELTDDGIYKVQGSMTVIDNATGKVTAVIGGRTQPDTDTMFSLNRAYQGYAQPGSSIKPLVVYTPAMEHQDDEDTASFLPNSVLFNIDVGTAKNAGRGEISEMTGQPVFFRNAVENSLNGCAYWLFNEIGISRGISHLTDMEFSKIVPSDYNIGTSLGGLTYGVTTEEMANAYYTLQNDGTFTDTDCIKSIVDRDGNEIYSTPQGKKIYETDAANAMTDIMKGVITSGTAVKSKWYSNTETEAAGKTGTTNDNKAAWFCGYTPYYTIAVWVGCDRPEPVKNLQGANYPLSIWKDAMLAFIADKPAAYLAELPEDMTNTEKCICGIRCVWGSENTECPVCKDATSQEVIDLICAGEAAECTCIVTCEGDLLNELCPACILNPSVCKGVNRNVPCICTGACTHGNINTACPRCSRNWVMCQFQNIQQDSCICATNCLVTGLNPGCEACLKNITSCHGIMEVPQTTVPIPEQAVPAPSSEQEISVPVPEQTVPASPAE